MSPRRLLLLLLSMLLLLTVGCSSTESRLKSESGLYDVQLNHSYKVALDGYWFNEKPAKYPKRGTIYVAPLDTHLVEKGNEEYMPYIRQVMDERMKSQLGRMLEQQSNKGAWKLTEKRNRATIIMEFSLVRFKPQLPALHVVSAVVGFIVVIPGAEPLLASFTTGDICVEGVIRDGRTGKLLGAFKDSNRTSAWLCQPEAYSSMGNAAVNWQHWADKMVYLCMASAQGRKQGITLHEMVEKRPLNHSLLDHLQALLPNFSQQQQAQPSTSPL